MTDQQMVEATVWLTLKPTFAHYGDRPVNGFRVAKMTKSRPESVPLAVKLKLRLPARAFAPLAPEVTITVPEDALVWPEPEVTVETP